MSFPPHELDPRLDARILGFAGGSWNAQHAAYRLQQLVSLADRYCELASWVDGADRNREKELWGKIADLTSAMTGLPASLSTLFEVGFVVRGQLKDITLPSPETRLADSPALDRVDLRPAQVGDLGTVLRRAVAHDTVAKPLLEALQYQIRRFDPAISGVVAELDSIPSDFPSWDGRPLFLAEQLAVLDYLSLSVAAEIIADLLVDQPLGEHLLRASGIVVLSAVVGEHVFDLNQVPESLLSKPVAVVCHEVGDTVLSALRGLDQSADALDMLYVAETAVHSDLGLDVSLAMAPTRRALTDRSLRDISNMIFDLRRQAVSTLDAETSERARPFDFPDLLGS